MRAWPADATLPSSSGRKMGTSPSDNGGTLNQRTGLACRRWRATIITAGRTNSCAWGDEAMVQQAIKNAAMDLDKVVQAARSGQVTLLLDGGKPIAYVGSGLCSRGELTSALLATRPERPGEVRIERGTLGRQWQSVIQRVRERCVVIVTEGRVLAGIVADDGPAGQGAIGTESSAYAERNRAILAGREVQITRRHQVV